MNIELSPEVALILETATVQARGKEFSGLGFVERRGNALYVYEVHLLDVGTEVLTEIKPERILPLSEREDRDNLRLFFHRHPIGNHIPGLHNWSATDEATIRQSPLGGVPELIGWSCSIVRTPDCWVGRIDNHKAGTTVHVPVKGQAEGVRDQMMVLWGEMVARQNKEQEHRWLGNLPYSYEWAQPSLFGNDYEGSWDDDYIAPNRDDYNTDGEYIDAICEMLDCDASELEIDPAGRIWYGTEEVGRGVDPEFMLQDEEEEIVDVSTSEDLPFWKRIFR